MTAAAIDYALAYARRGWPVLPVRPRDKRPLNGNGIEHATLDTETIRDWFERTPDANIGIRLDAAGLVALDFDPRNGGDLAFADDYPQTLTAQTGGGGRHLVYRMTTDARLPGAIGPGIDVKHRGYIVVEPSCHPSGEAYHWLDWDPLQDDDPPIAECPETIAASAADGAATQGDLAPATVAGATSGAAIPAGGRNATLSREAYRLRKRGLAVEQITPVLLALNASACKPPLPEWEVRAIAEGKRTVAPEPSPPGQEIADGGADGDLEPIAPEFSDDFLALAFVKQYGLGFRWTPGLDWMRDTGTHWTRDDHMTRWQAARTICRAAAHEAPEKGSDRKRLASAKTVAAVLTLAQTDERIVVPSAAWDAEPMLLNTPAGIVDLTTGKMRARRHGDYMTQITAVAPSTTVPAPNWRRFISEVFSGDEEMVGFVQRVLGYCLTGDRREQKVFFAHGEGSNGKNTLVDQVLWIMGTYALKLPTSALMQSPIDRHPTELAQLRGKRLAISNELDEGQFWAEARIKELTGDEFLNARFMRQDSFTFLQTQKHLIAGNYKPRLRGGDPAMARRMVLIPFVQTFEGARKDLSLPAKIRAEAPAVLAWLIAGAVAWHRDGLKVPAAVERASADYMDEHDDTAQWAMECCDRSLDVKSKAVHLYESFALWKRVRGEHAPSQTVWGQRLPLLRGEPKIVKQRHAGGVVYAGIALKPEAVEWLKAAKEGSK